MNISKIIRIGEGKECSKCSKIMERRKHRDNPIGKNYFYTQSDYCKDCKHIQHYEHFKSSAWQEAERQKQFMKSL